MSLILYGIKNCDTVRKASKWLTDHDIDFEFHDYREQGLTKTKLSSWVIRLGWEELLNRRSTTWRQLSETDKKEIDNAKAIRLMRAQLTLIKRPILENNQTLLVGFSTAAYAQLTLNGDI